MRSPHLLRLAPALLLVGIVAGPVVAQLPPAEYSFVLTSGGGFGTGKSFSKTGNLPMEGFLDNAGVALDQSVNPPQPAYAYNLQSRAELFGGLNPMVIATASAQGENLGQPIGLTSTAYGRISYIAQILPTTPDAPEVNFPIPVRIDWRMDVTGDAEARVHISNYHLFHSLIITRGQDSYESFDKISILPGPQAGASIELIAGAKAYEQYGLNPTDPPHFSQAVADPLFSFEQEEFNAMMGPDAFNLSDYYAFVYSPGIIVPEPAAMMAAASAVASAAIRRRRGCPLPVS